MASGNTTTFAVTNYEGPLYYLTPDDTPLISILGAEFGGESHISTYFSWQTSDLRAAAQTGALEGAAFPTAQHRTRSVVKNVMQIIHEGVNVSDTKQGAFGQLGDVGAGHPNVFGTSQGNPITTELDWQVAQSLKQVKRDMEYAVINGALTDPSTASTARKTRGLIEAISTNSVSESRLVGSSLTGSSSDDVVAATAHGLSNGDKVNFTAITGGSGITTNTTYYVIAAATNTFQISATSGGSAVTFADFTGATIYEVFDITTDGIGNLMQTVYDAGGIMEQETAAIVVNSWNKRQLTEAFLSAGNAGFRQSDRNLGGTSLDTFQTDFGKVNVILDRHVPQHTALVLSLEQLRLMWLDRPHLPRLAVEPLARTGLAQNVQISGEWGLMYGNELAHGKLIRTSTR